MSRSMAFHEEARGRRRDLSCVASGVSTGVGLGWLAGVIAWPVGLGMAIGSAVGALAGGTFGRWAAYHLSADEWDPPPSHRPYVGANSPDDDIASN
jgi:hypothetical protein